MINNMKLMLNDQRPDKTGRFPLRIRMYKNGKLQYITLDIKLKVEEWDAVAQHVVKNTNKGLLNAAINKRISELQAELLSGEITGNAGKKDNVVFIEWAKRNAAQSAQNEAAGTVKHKKAYLAKFDRFAPGVKMKDITSDLLYRYEKHCKGLGNNNNTVWSSIKHLKTFINEAIRQGLINPAQISTFKRTRYEDPERKYLTLKQVGQIEKVAAGTDELANYARWFLFECYTGLRYGDAAAFTKDKIKGNKIVIRTEKSKSDVSIPLHPKLKALIPKLQGSLPDNQTYNRALKRVAIKSKIGFPISSHSGRHTFAVLFLEGNGSMEVLSKILGHSSIKNTQIYGKITDKRIESEMQKAFG